MVRVRGPGVGSREGAIAPPLYIPGPTFVAFADGCYIAVACNSMWDGLNVGHDTHRGNVLGGKVGPNGR